MKRVDDEKAWFAAWLDTPFWPQPGLGKALRPGVCVMSKSKGADGWPEFFGKVVTYDEAKDVAMVRSVDDKDPAHPQRTVWTGTCWECRKMWEID